jgi:2-polyprenyl-6-methoxyphenol hydroxylase-like FAD-dependent oxidoreductase
MSYTPPSRAARRGHAVVLGASVAGLLAARVLSDRFDHVTVVERDLLPAAPDHRRGVPQGRHVHALHPRGLQVLEELFPGLAATLHDDGVPEVNSLHEVWVEFGGHLLDGSPASLATLVVPSRPLLEARIRERVLAIPNLETREHTSAVGPVATRDRRRVTGVCVTDIAGGTPEELAADLVVDCTGRAAHGPVWLCQLGYERPEEEQVRVGISYVSVPVRLPADAAVEQMVFVGIRPGRPYGMALFGYEGGTSILTVAVMGGEPPAPELEAMLARIEGVAPPHVMAALRRAEQQDLPTVFKFPASRRRRYDRLRRLPDGFVPLGDSLCSFNPVYGQGMTVAAMQALALREALGGADRGLPRRFLRAARRPVDVAWDLAVGADLALPEVEGERTRRVRLINAWVDRVLTAAESDPVVAAQFVRVIGMLDAPTALFRPAIARRVLRRTPAVAAPRRAAIAQGAAG